MTFRPVFLLPPLPRLRDWWMAGACAGLLLGLAELAVAFVDGTVFSTALTAVLLAASALLVSALSFSLGAVLRGAGLRLSYSQLVGATSRFDWIEASVLAKVKFDYARLVFGVYSIALIGLLTALVLRPWPALYRRGAFKLVHPVLALAPLFVLLNGLSPYLGLKTHTSFAMFSGLQTEGENWNHLILPRAMRIFHFQDDLVEIVESDHPRLARYAANGDRFVHFQFHDFVSRNPNIAVRYNHAGYTRTVPRVGDDPELSKRPNFLLRRVMWFRPVRTATKGVCPY